MIEIRFTARLRTVGRLLVSCLVAAGLAGAALAMLLLR